MTLSLRRASAKCVFSNVSVTETVNIWTSEYPKNLMFDMYDNSRIPVYSVYSSLGPLSRIYGVSKIPESWNRITSEERFINYCEHLIMSIFLWRPALITPILLVCRSSLCSLSLALSLYLFFFFCSTSHFISPI